mgnify:CR=1 FL=1
MPKKPAYWRYTVRVVAFSPNLMARISRRSRLMEMLTQMEPEMPCDLKLLRSDCQRSETMKMGLTKAHKIETTKMRTRSAAQCSGGRRGVSLI